MEEGDRGGRGRKGEERGSKLEYIELERGRGARVEGYGAIQG